MSKFTNTEELEIVNKYKEKISITKNCKRIQMS